MTGARCTRRTVLGPDNRQNGWSSQDQKCHAKLTPTFEPSLDLSCAQQTAAPTAGITTAYPQSAILSRYDRRGFGRSDKTRSDYGTLADDLDEVIIELDLIHASLVAVDGEIDADSCAEQLNGARPARCKVSAVRRNRGLEHRDARGRPHLAGARENVLDVGVRVLVRPAELTIWRRVKCSQQVLLDRGACPRGSDLRAGPDNASYGGAGLAWSAACRAWEPDGGDSRSGHEG